MWLSQYHKPQLACPYTYGTAKGIVSDPLLRLWQAIQFRILARQGADEKNDTRTPPVLDAYYDAQPQHSQECSNKFSAPYPPRSLHPSLPSQLSFSAPSPPLPSLCCCSSLCSLSQPPPLPSPPFLPLPLSSLGPYSDRPPPFFLPPLHSPFLPSHSLPLSAPFLSSLPSLSLSIHPLTSSYY